MEVLVFESLTTSLGEPGQPFAWAAAGLDDERSLGLGHWITSPRPQDGWDVNPTSMAIQGYLEHELTVRDCFRDAARDFCAWLAKRFQDDHLLVATSNPATVQGRHDSLTHLLLHDPNRWWRIVPDVIDTRSLAQRAGTPDPPWVSNEEPGRLDLAQRRLARGLQALRRIPCGDWIAYDPRCVAQPTRCAATTTAYPDKEIEREAHPAHRGTY